MYLGEIVELAAYNNLYSDPKHPYTQALLSAIPVTDPKATKDRIILKGDVPSPINPPSGCSFHPRCAYKMEVCDKDEPELNNVGGNHYVACYLY
jgi:oligopeptide/dipeptide ABC transporter ATP-binding protein